MSASPPAACNGSWLTAGRGLQRMRARVRAECRSADAGPSVDVELRENPELRPARPHACEFATTISLGQPTPENGSAPVSIARIARGWTVGRTVSTAASRAWDGPCDGQAPTASSGHRIASGKVKCTHAG